MARIPSRLRKNSSWLYSVGLIAVVVLVFGILQITHVTHFFESKPYSGSSYTKGEPPIKSNSIQSNSSDNSSNSSAVGQPGDTKSDSGGSSNAVSLVQPTGDFVSNHHPNMSGYPAPNTMTSVCTTSPGATCVISFTKDAVTKSLSIQNTDRGGSAYWNWKLQDIGLTAGSWQIKATATLGGQSKSTTDAMQLVVSP